MSCESQPPVDGNTKVFDLVRPRNLSAVYGQVPIGMIFLLLSFTNTVLSSLMAIDPTEFVSYILYAITSEAY